MRVATPSAGFPMFTGVWGKGQLVSKRDYRPDDYHAIQVHAIQAADRAREVAEEARGVLAPCKEAAEKAVAVAALAERLRNVGGVC